MGWYLPNTAPDKMVQKEMAARIAPVSDDQVSMIVTRIGQDWLGTARRDLIVNKLTARRTELARLCGIA